MTTDTTDAQTESASLPQATREKIGSMVESDKIVLFMKGVRTAPQCGFSAQVVQILDRVAFDYTTFDVLSDPELREGIKEFSDWPTIPQLYIDGEFQGGCDIVREMYETGELHQALDIELADPGEISIEVSDEARELIASARSHYGGGELHLGVDARFRYSLGFGPATGNEVEVQAGDLKILLDRDSARRADGIVISAVDSGQGRALDIQNPNQPGVQMLSAAELETWRCESRPHRLIDVRTSEERETASIDGSEQFDKKLEQELLALAKDTTLVFHCHHGGRAQNVAQAFAARGFTEVYNLVGGIDAWSQESDPSVPRY